MAQVWMHNGFLQVEGQKMSKSLRNFVTIHELLRGWKGRAWSGSAVRWAMLQTQYRQPIDWTLDLLTRSAIEIIEIINLLRGCFRDRESGKVNFEKIDQALADYSPDGELVDALTDDLNTPDAMLAIREKKSSRATDIIECVGGLMFLGVLKESDLKYYSNFHGIATDVENREKILALVDDFQIARANNDVSFMASVSTELDKLGLQLKENEPSQLVIVRKVDITSVADFRKNVNELVDARSAARAAKNWGEADRIRNELAGMGIQLMDSKDPDSGEIKTTWEVKR
jgi:cysteinyl-tRNA synthetase